MNSYQLISKLRKVRDDTYLTTAAQALYHELVAICNDMKWKDVFKKKNSDLCSILNMSEKTLIKSRSDLSDAGLLYFQSTKDKRIGCYYSFTTVISSVYFTDESTDDSTDETTDDNNGGGEIPPVESPVETSVKCLDDNLPSSVAAIRVSSEFGIFHPVKVRAFSDFHRSRYEQSCSTGMRHLPLCLFYPKPAY